MNITEHRKNYFHIDGIHSTKKEIVQGQETVEEFIARGGNVTIIKVGAFGYKSDLEKARDTVKRRKQGVHFRGDNNE